MRQPTEIQEKCIPAILSGRDVVGVAATGSGKTAAFALPILHTLSNDPFGVFALILTPTRELAFQISDQFSALGRPINVKCSVIVGGLDYQRQLLELSDRPHVVVATVGRLLDVLTSDSSFSPEKPTCPFSSMKFLVLDEADRLLDTSLADSLVKIVNFLPKERQTLLFSATLTSSVENAAKISKNNPFLCEIDDPFRTVPTLIQQFVLCPQNVKEAYLMFGIRKHISSNKNSSVIVFVSSCRKCRFIHLFLRRFDMKNSQLHGDMPQLDRMSSLSRFRSSRVQILVATDLASRGLDIPVVDLVINYDIPRKTKDYIHRVGRTARIGRGGRSLTLVTQYDVELLQAIEKETGEEMEVLKHEEEDVLQDLKKVLRIKHAVNVALDEDENGNEKKRKRTRESRSSSDRKKSRK